MKIPLYKANFDGSSYFEFPSEVNVLDGSSFRYKMVLSSSGARAVQDFFGNRLDSHSRITSGSTSISYNAEQRTNVSWPIILGGAGKVELEFISDGDTVDLFYNGVSQGSQNLPTSDFLINSFGAALAIVSRWFLGSFYSCEIEVNDVLLFNVTATKDGFKDSITNTNLVFGGGTITFEIYDYLVIPEHEPQLRKLNPIELGGDWPEIVEVEGRNLDLVLEDVDYIEANLLPDRMIDEEIASRWENLFGLPVPSAATMEERQAIVIAKFQEQGGLSKEYFETIALAMGYTVTIESPKRFFRAGVSRCNDTLHDPLKGFRALCGDVEGGLICSSDHSDEATHDAHNDLKRNTRLYSKDSTPRQWVWTIQINGETRESADPLIKKLMELKPAFTFIEWGFMEF